MCGIAGIIGSQKYCEKDAKKMIDMISYRGPDEQGTVNLGNIYLGHARLAVVDPENGTQPMFDEFNEIGIVFVGEIYNYEELKIILEKKNYKFHSKTDTEVLILGYKYPSLFVWDWLTLNF